MTLDDSYVEELTILPGLAHMLSSTLFLQGSEPETMYNVAILADKYDFIHLHGIGFCGEKGFQHAMQRFGIPHIGGVEARVYVWLINRCPGVS